MTDRQLFEGKREQSRATDDKLLSVLSKIGKPEVESKKTSIHISHGRAFVEVHAKLQSLKQLNVHFTKLLKVAYSLMAE